MKRQRGRYSQPVDFYSAEYHLSRPVCCVVCGVRLHKTLAFVLAGHRCRSCSQVSPAPLGNMASH